MSLAFGSASSPHIGAGRLYYTDDHLPAAGTLTIDSAMAMPGAQTGIPHAGVLAKAALEDLGNDDTGAPPNGSIVVEAQQDQTVGSTIQAGANAEHTGSIKVGTDDATMQAGTAREGIDLAKAAGGTQQQQQQ